MKALIDENKKVVQISQDTFGVAEPCFWVDCTEDIVAGIYKYENNTFVLIENVSPTAEQNKQEAEKLLLSSDWVMLQDVNISNKSSWESYRADLRLIARNPSNGNILWPAKPKIIWE